MRRILFDGTSIQSFGDVKFHGGSEYAKYIFHAALKHGYKFDIVLSDGRNTDPEILETIEKHGLKVHHVNSKYEIYDILTKSYDIFYSALPYDYDDYNASCELIGVIHGIRSIEFSYDEFMYKSINPRRRFGYFRWKKRIEDIKEMKNGYKREKNITKFHKLLSIPNARFITVSNTTKASILNFFPNIDVDNIKVFYSPIELDVAQAPRLLSDIGDYYLVVSANRPEKNIYRTMLAFDKLFSDGRLEGKKVVVTGFTHYTFMDEIKNPDRFVLHDYVEENVLQELFSKAFCLIYASLNEGFGYPPLKAMSMGVPVIASSATSIPEVCGDAAYYFPPKSIDDLRNRIIQINYDSSLRDWLIERGLSRAQFIKEKIENEITEQLEYIFGYNQDKNA